MIWYSCVSSAARVMKRLAVEVVHLGTTDGHDVHGTRCRCDGVDARRHVGNCDRACGRSLQSGAAVSVVMPLQNQVDSVFVEYRLPSPRNSGLSRSLPVEKIG